MVSALIKNFNVRIFNRVKYELHFYVHALVVLVQSVRLAFRVRRCGT